MLFRSQAGFERPILHGLCTYGVAGRALLRGLVDADPLRLKSMSCRFSAPVYPGETLVTELWKLGDGRAAFQSRIAERNILVLAPGLAVHTDTCRRINPDRTHSTPGRRPVQGTWGTLSPEAAPNE